jgi:heme/copper-type cytochrome/quinol oxidase subunit 3
MHDTSAIDYGTPYGGIGRGKFAMWLFLASEVMFFAGLIGAYVVFRTGAAAWPIQSEELNVPLTAFNTFVLICSSVTMVRALYKAQQGDQAGMKQNLLATALLGMFFLSVQVYEYYHLYHEGLTPWRDLFGSAFYTLTGFHGAHVTGGVIALWYLIIRAYRGDFSATRWEGIENVGLYWHFVDLVWILLFNIVYLV